MVIPKAIRERAGLRAGVALEIELVRGCIEILPAVAPTRIVEEQGVSVLVPSDAATVSVEAVRQVQEQARGG